MFCEFKRKSVDKKGIFSLYYPIIFILYYTVYKFPSLFYVNLKFLLSTVMKLIEFIKSILVL